MPRPETDTAELFEAQRACELALSDWLSAVNGPDDISRVDELTPAQLDTFRRGVIYHDAYRDWLLLEYLPDPYRNES